MNTTEPNAEPVRLIDSSDDVVSALREVATDGLDLVVQGTSDSRTGASLVRVNIEGGVVQVPVVESEGVFSNEALSAWREEYPYQYAFSRDLNVFYTSTGAIGVSALPRRAVIIASTDLQSFPANLLNVDGDLAGWNHRLAVAPSLTWLLNSRRNPFAGEGRTVAWIPSDIPEEGIPALGPLADDLAPSLARFGARLERGVGVPEDLTAADVAIVAAHGGVGEDAKYFRVVTDDTNVAIAPGSFADHFKGTGVAVLFVCSGGRLDPHPRASAVVGLVKQILDSGCRTVIAPPWPLSVAVPRVWLPAFMEQWANYVPAIDAVFEANMVVRRQMGNNPSEALAMSVYGDPLTRRTEGNQPNR